MEKPVDRVIPALGRSFTLGYLYDVRRDCIVNKSLWDLEDLKGDNDKVSVDPQPYSNFSVAISDTIEDKTSLMNISASLKMSFLGGLVKVGGSAKYLDTRNSSSRVSSVTATWSTTTETKRLSMNLLASQNVKYREMLDSGEATHVIAGITYGANAYFRFEKALNENENKKEVGGELEISVKTIPSFSIEGKGSVEMKENDKIKMNNIKCEFYGDYTGIQIPTNFEEAVKVLGKLSSDENLAKSVPVTVFLTPLHSIDSGAGQLVREISGQSVDKATKIKTYFDQALEKIDYMKQFKTVKSFSLYSDYLKKVFNSFETEAICFKESMAKILPKIRGEGMEEIELLKVLKDFQDSRFANHHFDRWYQHQEDEIKTSDMILTKLEDGKITIATSKGEFRRETMNETGYKGTITLKLDFVSNMEDAFSTISEISLDTTKAWFEEDDFFESLMNSIDTLVDTAKNNPQYRVLAYLEFGQKESKCKISFLQKGKLVYENMDLEIELKNMLEVDSKDQPDTVMMGPSVAAAEAAMEQHKSWETVLITNKTGHSLTVDTTVASGRVHVPASNIVHNTSEAIVTIGYGGALTSYHVGGEDKLVIGWGAGGLVIVIVPRNVTIDSNTENRMEKGQFYDTVMKEISSDSSPLTYYSDMWHVVGSGEVIKINHKHKYTVTISDK